LLSLGVESFVFQFATKNAKIKIYITIIFPILFWCEIWSLALREEQRLRVSENRVLRGVFGPKREEVKREWRKLRNEELNDLYFSPNVVRVIKTRRILMGGAHSAHGRQERPEGK
jgi:hypothetical protein